MKYLYLFVLYSIGVYFAPVSLISFVTWNNWFFVSFEGWAEIVRFFYMVCFLVVTTGCAAFTYDIYKGRIS